MVFVGMYSAVARQRQRPHKRHDQRRSIAGDPAIRSSARCDRQLTIALMLTTRYPVTGLQRGQTSVAVWHPSRRFRAWRRAGYRVRRRTPTPANTALFSLASHLTVIR
jgi:hypothetical protein